MRAPKLGAGDGGTQGRPADLPTAGPQDALPHELRRSQGRLPGLLATGLGSPRQPPAGHSQVRAPHLEPGGAHTLRRAAVFFLQREL